MKYNFDKKTNRFNTGSVKWNVKENELPMWIADMDFETCDEIKEAIIKKANLGIYGYSDIIPEWSESIYSWYKSYHNFEMQKENIIFTSGIVASLSSLVRRLTHPNENVVILTPVYGIFFNSIINNGARPLESNLLLNEDNTYSIDWLDLESKLKNPLTTLMILCNPHNPTGNIWSKEDLIKIASLCKTHGVKVISDEAHSELIDPGFNFVPFISVSSDAKEVGIMCASTSKTFNLAGIHGAFVYVENLHLKEVIERGFNNDEIAEPNIFAIDAMRSAYTYGKVWLDELREYLLINKEYVYSFIENNIPLIRVTKAHATYLLWIDVSKLTNNSEELVTYLKEKTGLILSSGTFFKGDGNTHLRINVACQKERVIDGMNRLQKGIELFIKEKNT